jgi:hypothetical protein
MALSRCIDVLLLPLVFNFENFIKKIFDYFYPTLKMGGGVDMLCAYLSHLTPQGHPLFSPPGGTWGVLYYLAKLIYSKIGGDLI